MKNYGLKYLRLLFALTLGLTSLLLFYFAIRRAIPYSRSYPFAVFAWVFLTLGVVLSQSFLSLKVFSHRVFVVLAWLSPTVILITFPQSVLYGFGAVSPYFIITIAIFYGIPLYVAVRNNLHTNVNFLKVKAIQCIILGISVIVTLGVLELFMRALGLQSYTPVSVTASHVRSSSIPGLLFELKPNHRWGIKYPTNPRGYFNDDNTIYVKTNSSGFRDSEFELEKKPSTYRIALLGDSFGFGYGVQKEDGVADRIEEFLGRMIDQEVEVYNFSVPGYSTVEEAILLESTVMKYQPDLIIIWFYINDPKYLGRLEDIQSDIFKVFPILRKHSSVFYLLGSRFDEIIPRKKTIELFRAVYRDGDQRWLNCEKSLRKMGQLALENDIPIYLFVHPILYGFQGDYLFSDIHQKVIETAERDGIKAYDLLDVFEGRDARSLWVHLQDMHPNEIAHEIAARFVVEVLTKEEFKKGRAGGL